MPRPRRSKKRLKQVLLSALGAMIVGYFIYHTIQGERGWFAMVRMQNEVKQAETTLGGLREQREDLEHRTQLLRAGSMDPDLLDEKSRELLNYSKPNEIIVLTPKDVEKDKDAK